MPEPHAVPGDRETDKQALLRMFQVHILLLWPAGNSIQGETRHGQTDNATPWQEELIASEEERLAISQALLTMQLDLNHAQVSFSFDSTRHARSPAGVDHEITICA